MKPPHPHVAKLLELVRARRVDVICPLCCATVSLVATIDHTADAVAIGPHRYAGVPIVTPGMQPLVWRARCPMSYEPISEACDGEHAAPACSDPQCYHTRIAKP